MLLYYTSILNIYYTSILKGLSHFQDHLCIKRRKKEKAMDFLDKISYRFNKEEKTTSNDILIHFSLHYH